MVVGLNHRSAPVALREQWAVSPEQLPPLLHQLKAQLRLSEVVLLSTCNRTEVYAVGAEPSALIQTWHQVQQAPVTDPQHFYAHQHAQAAQHLMRVACGLDSLILGETEILGQVKNAYECARNQGMTGPGLGRLFQHSLKTAKQVRTRTELCAHPISIAFAAVHLVKHVYTRWQDVHVAVVGAGVTAELMAKHFQAQGVQRWSFVNRSWSKAQALASRYQGQAAPLEALAEVVAQADVVVCATHSPKPLITQAMLAAERKPAQHVKVILDVSVPCNSAADVGQLPHVLRYTVDDLDHVVDANQRLRRMAAEEAESMVDEEVAEFMRWWQAQSGMKSIQAYRSRWQAVHQAMEAEALARLRSGGNPEDVVRWLGRGLMNKTLHPGTAQLRHALLAHDADRLACVLRFLELDDELA